MVDSFQTTRDGAVNLSLLLLANWLRGGDKCGGCTGIAAGGLAAVRGLQKLRSYCNQPTTRCALEICPSRHDSVLDSRHSHDTVSRSACLWHGLVK